MMPSTLKRRVFSTLKPLKEVKTTKLVQKSYTQIVLSSQAQGAEKTWTEFVGKNQKQKNTTPNPPKLELEKKRVTF